MQYEADRNRRCGGKDSTEKRINKLVLFVIRGIQTKVCGSGSTDSTKRISNHVILSAVGELQTKPDRSGRKGSTNESVKLFVLSGLYNPSEDFKKRTKY